MTASAVEPFHVVFVCTGNICRSPMADVVFRWFAEAAGLGDRVASTSAGTGDWHVGERADVRTIDALGRLGYDGTRHRARQFTHADFERNDLVVALDRSHERILRGWARTEADADKIALLMSFDPRRAQSRHPGSVLCRSRHVRRGADDDRERQPGTLPAARARDPPGAVGGRIAPARETERPPR